MKTNLENWVEWRKLCALDLCSGDTKKRLTDFVDQKFYWYAQKYAGKMAGLSAFALVGNVGNCWHLFETHLTVGKNRNGKTLKRWLFARVAGSEDPPMKVIQGGAKLLVRDVVRKNIISESSPANTISINRPVESDSGGAITIEDLLPGNIDTAGDVERREMEELAKSGAEQMFANLSFLQRLALLTKELNISLANPAVEQAAGCKKSAINDAWRSAVSGIAEKVRAEFCDDDPETVRILAQLTLESVKTHIFLWSATEKRCVHLLALRKEQ